MNENTCIGCGCTELDACVDGLDEPCHWLAVDEKAARGVCSQCAGHLQRFNAGDREIRVDDLRLARGLTRPR